MSIARIIWIVALLAAIVLAFVNTGQDALILAILGLVCGWFVDHEHRSGLIIAAIFLMAGAGAWGGITGVGEHLTAIFSSYGAVLGAASLTAICRTTAERLFLNKGTAA
jgi:hypothetical protein